MTIQSIKLPPSANAPPPSLLVLLMILQFLIIELLTPITIPPDGISVSVELPPCIVKPSSTTSA